VTDKLEATWERIGDLLEPFDRNHLHGGTVLVLPHLERYNELRVELGLEPLTRDQVPVNILFVSEMEPEDE